MQLTVRQHTASDYASLPDMTEPTVGILSKEDQFCLQELGRCLLTSRANMRFGISLLHSHFPTFDKEVFVQTSDAEGQTVSLQPMIFDRSAEESLTAINLKFSSNVNENTLGMVGLEYVFRSRRIGIDPIQADDIAVLSSVQRILQEQSKIGRFGVRLIHFPVPLAYDEIYSETCDLDRRVLTCRVVNETDPQLARSIETFWIWPNRAKDGNEHKVYGHCPAKCKVTCFDGKPGHPHGHKDMHETISSTPSS